MILKKKRLLVGMVALIVACAGCHTVPVNTGIAPQKESLSEVTSALGTVTEALSGVPIDEKKLKTIARDLEKDPQAQSAVKSITDSLRGQRIIKYCPVCGKRYAPTISECPDDKVLLNELQE